MPLILPCPGSKRDADRPARPRFKVGPAENPWHDWLVPTCPTCPTFSEDFEK
jgi:hypothetical protein